MNQKTTKLINKVKDNFVSAVTHSSEAIQKMEKKLKIIIQSTEKTGVALIESLRDTIEETLEVIIQAEGNIRLEVKILVISFLREIKATGREFSQASEYIVRLVIKTISKTGGDVIAAAQGVVEGIFEQTKNLGVDSSEAAIKAAGEAVKAAYDISEELGDNVYEALKETISQLKIPVDKRKT